MAAGSFASVVALALGLAMDATAAAAACGAAAPTLRGRHFVIVAAYFGGFQALMPLLGWLFAAWIGPAIAAWDHWLAVALLGGIGGKMIYEAWREGRGGESAEREPARRTRDMFGVRIMVGLAIATSIDAAAAGLTLTMFDVPVGISLATIGVLTAALAALGLAVGRRAGTRLGRELDVLGGLVLIGLGLKILIEHLVAG